MVERETLFLYEEIVLLALREKEGTFATGYVEHLIAGAILAELLLDQRISVGDSRKQLVDLIDGTSFGDPIIDESLEKMEFRKKPESLQGWISILAVTKNLTQKVAHQLCDRGILRADEDKVLLIFTRQIYPEVDPVPEQQIVERLREGIFGDGDQLDSRTALLISLAHGVDLLKQSFGRKELRTRKERIQQITNGDLTGKATQDVIAGFQAAAAVAAIMPIVLTTTIHS